MFKWTGGTHTKADIWDEICGDGKNLGKFEWDDGNVLDNDGWSSSWEIEKWYEWKGGNAIFKDICSLPIFKNYNRLIN